MRQSRRPRSSGVNARQASDSNALRAEATAASTSAGPASAKTPMTWPLAGLTVSLVLPPEASTHSSAMNNCVVCMIFPRVRVTERAVRARGQRQSASERARASLGVPVSELSAGAVAM